ncbi:hypothetical protein A0H81_01025 [Grifola frondosa]|nr:hypothetical protein A0H81_03258 [Grifola frondosa]OBZ76878.1 hypothetical protein A0H81_03032 [Grifola frondosa]OBZ78567.1 hypothetical protein A0H81_01025 [Grifola frondosa]
MREGPPLSDDILRSCDEISSPPAEWQFHLGATPLPAYWRDKPVAPRLVQTLRKEAGEASQSELQRKADMR